jgi:hypothetical protein
MGKITSIDYWEKGDRYFVKIDGKDCPNPERAGNFSIRARTLPALNLYIGMEITCEELYEKEKNFWKHIYKESFKKEKVRIDAVKELIHKLNDNIQVNVVGFGADSEDIIDMHPEEKGVPDLDIVNKTTGGIIAKVEVTGTAQMKGDDYWVRPDKLIYARKHKDENVWVALHYQKPSEKVVFIKPDINKEYKHQERQMSHGGVEYYVSFNESDKEVKTLEDFRESLNLF